MFFLFFFGVDPESVRILRGDASQTLGGGDGVGSAEALCDEDGGAGGECHGVAAGNLDGVDLAGEFDFLVHVGTKSQPGRVGKAHSVIFMRGQLCR